MNVVLSVHLVSWQASRSEEKTVMLIPFLGTIAGGVVTIKPHHVRYHLVALSISVGKSAPLVREGVGPRVGA